MLVAGFGELPGPDRGQGQMRRTFDQVVEHYEAVRLALTNDTTDGIAQSQAKRSLHHPRASLPPTGHRPRPDVQADNGRRCPGPHCPELSEGSRPHSPPPRLSTQARDAFYELSKPLVRWRKVAERSKKPDRRLLLDGQAARGSSPEGELGNPYYGQSMLRCGEVVDG